MGQVFPYPSLAEQATGADGPPSRLFSASSASLWVGRRSPPAFGVQMLIRLRQRNPGMGNAEA
jgi:hypothetical protein